MVKEKKKMVSYYLKVSNDEFIKAQAKKTGLSKNEIMDGLIEGLKDKEGKK